MTSKATRRFWKRLENPGHPSLDFKKLGGRGERFSVRVGDHYRPLGRKITDGVKWVALERTRNITSSWDEE